MKNENNEEQTLAGRPCHEPNADLGFMEAKTEQLLKSISNKRKTKRDVGGRSGTDRVGEDDSR